MKGRRLSDQPHGSIPADARAGDYWRCTADDGSPIHIVGTPSNLTGGEWYVVTPFGQLGHLVFHTVREEDDGTISVRPGDGSSNSILVKDHRGEWHGYIEHGEWRGC